MKKQDVKWEGIDSRMEEALMVIFYFFIRFVVVAIALPLSDCFRRDIDYQEH